MSEFKEFPKMVYREGSMTNYKGIDLDHVTVQNQEEERKALSQGYKEPNKAVKHIRLKNKLLAPFKFVAKHWQFWLMFTVALIGALAALLQVLGKQP